MCLVGGHVEQCISLTAKIYWNYLIATYCIFMYMTTDLKNTSTMIKCVCMVMGIMAFHLESNHWDPLITKAVQETGSFLLFFHDVRYKTHFPRPNCLEMHLSAENNPILLWDWFCQYNLVLQIMKKAMQNFRFCCLLCFCWFSGAKLTEEKILLCTQNRKVATQKNVMNHHERHISTTVYGSHVVQITSSFTVSDTSVSTWLISVLCGMQVSSSLGQ